jgi:hypothetical protein
VLARLPLLRARTRLESLASREATFLYNNLLLVALCLTVLWGVAYPLLSEAVRGEAVTVGRPYYDFFLRVFGLPLLLLMGIGPLVAWRRASLRALAATFAWPAGVAFAAGIVLLALGAGSSIPGIVAYSFSAFVLAAIVLEFARGTRARQSLSAERWPGAFASLVARNRRRYGGYVVHAAVVLFALGIAGSEAYDTVSEQRLRPGETMQAGPYTLRYTGLTQRQGPNALELRAHVDVSRGDKQLGSLAPGKNRYAAEQQTSNEMAIQRDWLRAEDLPQGAREAAREPPLAGRRRLPGRLADRALARRARGASPRDPVRDPRSRRARMTALALVLGALLAAACVVFVARPFLREPDPALDRLDEPSEAERRALALAEERDRALAALKELEFDHRTGKVSDEDYRTLVGPLRARALAALRALEPPAPAVPVGRRARAKR